MPVTFKVISGDGILDNSDIKNFNNRVRAEKAGLAGSPVEFVASAQAGNPGKMLLVSGDNQLGSVGQPLAENFVVNETATPGCGVLFASTTFATIGRFNVSPTVPD